MIQNTTSGAQFGRRGWKTFVMDTIRSEQSRLALFDTISSRSGVALFVSSAQPVANVTEANSATARREG